jgi:YVTN family beta-propeller protein
VALALAAVVAAAAFVATRDSAAGLSGVRPNHVGLIDPGTNEIVAEVPVGVRPASIAIGAGSAWVGNLQDRSLTRIDLNTRTTAGTISLENRTPTGIAVGAGAVWVAHGARGEVSRVDPQFGQVTTTEVTGTTLGTQSGAVTIGAGSVWAVYADSTMARIDPTDVRVTGTTFAGSTPAGVVVGSGSVWVANSGEATVSRFNPSTFEEGPLRSPSVGRRPTGIAFGEGAIWVANAGDDAVTRIDPSTYAATPIPVGDEPVAIAVGEGAVWVASAGAGTVSRIDPETNEVTETIETGNAPSGIAVDGGTVWVSVQAP